jgi:hypothetical protein
MKCISIFNIEDGFGKIEGVHRGEEVGQGGE